MTTKGQTGLYVHWPFCLAKCPYCDFNAHVRETIDEEAWRKAYVKALDHYADLMPDREVVSVFFGGGTPSLMSADIVEAILEAVHKNWGVAGDIEVTLEANPTSVEQEKFGAFRAAGINRLSLGIQALNNPDLTFLGRRHNVKEALQALDITREIFDRFSFDLIYARPQQTLKAWEAELKQAAELAGGHLSLYQLTIERSTPFYLEHAQGRFSIPGEELAANFYTMTQDILEAEGLPAYEVSNHARPGHESRHNLIYWNYEDYIGVGPGAHGRLTLEGQKYATREHQAPEIWLERVQEKGSAVHPFEKIPPQDRFAEALMMGLRLRGGVSKEKLAAESGGSVDEGLKAEKLADMKAQGWLEETDTHFILNREGQLRLNAILPYILKEAA